jgi:hypothetical protein
MLHTRKRSFDGALAEQDGAGSGNATLSAFARTAGVFVARRSVAASPAVTLVDTADFPGRACLEIGAVAPASAAACTGARCLARKLW